MNFTNKGKDGLVKGAKPKHFHCGNCGNAGDHPLMWWEVGRIIRYMGKSLGKKEYGYVCPICDVAAELVTPEAAKLLKKGIDPR